LDDDFGYYDDRNDLVDFQLFLHKQPGDPNIGQFQFLHRSVEVQA